MALALILAVASLGLFEVLAARSVALDDPSYMGMTQDLLTFPAFLLIMLGYLLCVVIDPVHGGNPERTIELLTVPCNTAVFYLVIRVVRRLLAKMAPG